MRKVLNLPSHVQMEYRNHKDVLNWVSSRDKDGYKARTGSPPPIERNPASSLGGGDGGGYSRGAPPGMSLR